MRVYSFFENEGQLEPVEVELQLLPGIPQLKVIGLPDAHLKESALRIKSALTAQGFQWPRGHQVIVNLRPTHLRKASRGVELAMAVALIWETGQAACPWNLGEKQIYLYGELGLTGEVRCPEDIESVPDGKILLLGGRSEPASGRYFEISRLADLRSELSFREHGARRQWRRPEPLPLLFSDSVARILKILALSEASALLAGPPGTGKSTFAQALHFALADPPPDLWETSRSLYAREGRRLEWRPFVNPHHTIPPLSMIGGGYPLFPGEIAKAHGGLLVLDELLLFQPAVLEALREPLESGQMRISRRGHTRIWPAHFQFIGTTNLCPCGRLSPDWKRGCAMSLRRCRSTWERLSGPVLDRFDVLIFTQDWNRGEKSVALADMVDELQGLRLRAPELKQSEMPMPLADPAMSMRRRRAMSRIARALALLAGSKRMEGEHWLEANRLCVQPLETFRQLFA